MYSKEVLERFQKPVFSGEIENPDGVGEVGNPRCGDMMKLFIKVKKENSSEIIEDIKFKTYGCVAAIVSTDYLCEIAKGLTLDQAQKITSKDIAAKIGDIPPIKYHCSVLAQEALKKAISNYREKRAFK